MNVLQIRYFFLLIYTFNSLIQDNKIELNLIDVRSTGCSDPKSVNFMKIYRQIEKIITTPVWMVVVVYLMENVNGVYLIY